MNSIGIIGAMDEEIAILVDKIKINKKFKRAKMEFYVGRYSNKEVVVVKSGIGKVNASVCSQILVSEFHVDAVINTGVAGAIYDGLEVGDIVISQDVIQHDFDVTGFGGYKLGEIPRMDNYIFNADNDLINMAIRAATKDDVKHEAFVGRILSGDVFIASCEKKDFLWKEFKGYCTEMEGAAIGHACYLNNIPFVVIRAMSDKADGTAHVNFNDFFNEAAKNSTEIVLDMLTYMK